MTFRSQLPRDAASIEISASKQNQWLRFIAAMLARVEEGLVAFGEFMFPDLFEPPAMRAWRPDAARFQTRGPDVAMPSDRETMNINAGKPSHVFQHSGLDLSKGASRSQAAWNRARARRRRSR